MDEVSHLRVRKEALLIGICMDDFSLLHDVLYILKERNIHHVVLEQGDRWDSNMDALALQEGLNPPTFTLKIPPIVPISKDPEVTVDKVIACAFGRFEANELMVGIDPGKRPGISFVADGILISTHRSTGPEDILIKLTRGKKAFRPGRILVRIGNGDPVSRDPIILLIKKHGYSLEMVDEARTTKTKKFRDENAAVMIANTPGEPI